MTIDMLQPDLIAPTRTLGELVAGATPQLRDLADRCAAGLADSGLPCHVDIFDDWVKLTVRTDDGLLRFGLMEPEVSGLSPSGLPLRIGVELAFNVPSGEPLRSKPDVFFCLPSDFSIDQLIALGRGSFSPAQFTELLNFSVRHAMSAPRSRFPTSILLMISERNRLHTAGDKRFELWTQSRGKIDIVRLKPTSNPHEAAGEAQELGFYPTIYRCQSGVFVAFKATEGGVFL